MLGININTSPLSHLINKSIETINKRDNTIHFACANAHSAVMAQSDEEFLNALKNAEIVSADGTGITFMSRVVSEKTPPKITGYDYFYGLLKELDKNKSGRIFFFGSTEKVLKLIEEKLSKIFPSIVIVGVISPPFREWSKEENDNMISIINAAKADVLWVGMTAPKQEKWVYKNREKINVPIIGSVGAVFDFTAGTYARAPKWMSDYGMEWLYRTIKEPVRMGRRNLVSIPKFIICVLYDHIIKNKK